MDKLAPHQIDHEQYGYHDRVPLEVRRGLDRDDDYSIKLAGIELGRHLSERGVKIEFLPICDGGPAEPRITLVFPQGAVSVDLEAELIAHLRAKDAAEQTPVIVNHAPGCGDPANCPGC